MFPPRNRMTPVWDGAAGGESVAQVEDEGREGKLRWMYKDLRSIIESIDSMEIINSYTDYPQHEMVLLHYLIHNSTFGNKKLKQKLD